MESSVADQSSVADPGVPAGPDDAAPDDVVLLRARYTAAFERYSAYARKLAEHGGGGEPAPVHLLDAERQTLQEFARMRAALLEALVPVEPQIDPGFLRDCRDEAIRRSIAKRSETEAAASARRQRIDRRRKRARLFAVASERTGPEPARRSDEPPAVDDRPR
jgi:hypothetical protein